MMWTKAMVLGVAAVGAMAATSSCGSTDEELRMEDEAGAAERAAGQFCGGIAGIPCPEGTRCVDDPSDSCDPERGGADCRGVCVAEEQAEQCGTAPTKSYILREPAQCAAVMFACKQGSQPFFDACGCGCQAGEI